MKKYKLLGFFAQCLGGEGCREGTASLTSYWEGQYWAPFSSKWALAVCVYFHGTASTTKRPAGSYCKTLFRRSKKVQWRSMIYKTITTDCAVDLCTLPEEIILQLFNRLIAMLQCSLGWAVKADFIITSELRNRLETNIRNKTRKLAKVVEGSSSLLWKVPWDWFIRLSSE